MDTVRRMRRISMTATVACAIAAGAAGAAAQGADPAHADDQAARGLAKSLQCIACHGPAGVSRNPTFPHLAGQHAAYLHMQLHRFRSGERYDPLMTPVAQALTDGDMADLAAYFSGIAIAPAQMAERAR